MGVACIDFVRLETSTTFKKSSNNLKFLAAVGRLLYSFKSFDTALGNLLKEVNVELYASHTYAYLLINNIHVSTRG